MECQQFFRETGERAVPGEPFANASERMLRIEVDGDVWLKPGAAIAHRGRLTFTRLPTLTAQSMKDALLREAAPLVRATGTGRLYCADHGSHVQVVQLHDEALVVSWQDLLAFESTLDFEASLVGHGVGIAAGGLVVLRLTGRGALALATHGQPLTLEVKPGGPVMTDPHATLAWSGALTPALETDVTWRTVLGHGGSEAFQMRFDGAGVVLVQPYEDPGRFTRQGRALKRLASLVTA
jgi:uncharacterized protein (AIM24 family)